jgi:hypothetical protein
MSIKLFQQISNPKQLFLIDSQGALLSAFLLGVVLVHFEPLFGMPVNILYILALIAGIFFLYSFSCFLRQPEQWQPFLRGIAIANLSYCGLTLGLVLYLHQSLTTLGILYFVFEIIIVTMLALKELKTSFLPDSD